MINKTKHKLIKTGYELLKKRGGDNFSLRELSRECGVSHNTIYMHFKNKKVFINELATIAFNKLDKQLSAYNINNNKQIPDIVKKTSMAYITYFRNNPEHLFFFYNKGESIQLTNGEIIALKEHNFTKSRELLTIYFNDKKLATQRALLIWNFIHGLTILLVKEKILFKDINQIEEHIDQSLDLILRRS